MANAPLASFELIASLAIMAFSAVILVLSGLSVFPLILGLLMAVSITVYLIWNGFGEAGDNWRYMPGLAVWFVAALPIAIHNTIVAASTFNDPEVRAAAKLALLSAVILVTCPVVWIGL